jgi:hypothetical protein
MARKVIWKLASKRARGDQMRTASAAAPRALSGLRWRVSRRASEEDRGH